MKKDVQTLSRKALIEMITAVHERGLPFRFRASGTSMSPFIKDGDVITVAPRGENTISSGDIAAFIRHETDRLIVHRIVKKQGSSFLIRGDNTALADGLIPSSSILGIVTRIERGNKAVALGLGWERHIIAFLSQRSLLVGIIAKLSPLNRFFNALRKGTCHDRTFCLL